MITCRDREEAPEGADLVAAHAAEDSAAEVALAVDITVASEAPEVRAFTEDLGLVRFLALDGDTMEVADASAVFWGC